MKYIVYWILSWTAYVECPPQVDDFGRIINPGFSYNGCTEQRTKKLSKEFDDLQSATDFFKRALNEKSEKSEKSESIWIGWQTESIDTVWMTTEQLAMQLKFDSGTIIHFNIDTLTVGDSYHIKMKHEHNMACPKNCKEK